MHVEPTDVFAPGEPPEDPSHSARPPPIFGRYSVGGSSGSGVPGLAGDQESRSVSVSAPVEPQGVSACTPRESHGVTGVNARVPPESRGVSACTPVESNGVNESIPFESSGVTGVGACTPLESQGVSACTPQESSNGLQRVSAWTPVASQGESESVPTGSSESDVPSAFGMVVQTAKSRTQVIFNMTNYIQQAVEHYISRTGVKNLKKASTPYCPPGSLLALNDDIKGELIDDACSILMKDLWGARLSRPDLSRAVCRLAAKVHKWTRNDDRRLQRLMEHELHHELHVEGCCW